MRVHNLLVGFWGTHFRTPPREMGIQQRLQESTVQVITGNNLPIPMCSELCLSAPAQFNRELQIAQGRCVGVRKLTRKIGAWEGGGGEEIISCIQSRRRLMACLQSNALNQRDWNGNDSLTVC
uniref:Uncharacterized protein n=1 Tax=Eutreptiella gymnastica TaxID=73025 RepID=A0A7S4FSA1_9EUGL